MTDPLSYKGKMYDTTIAIFHCNYSDDLTCYWNISWDFI